MTAEHSREVPSVKPGNTSFGFYCQEVLGGVGENRISREEGQRPGFNGLSSKGQMEMGLQGQQIKTQGAQLNLNSPEI